MGGGAGAGAAGPGSLGAESESWSQKVFYQKMTTSTEQTCFAFDPNEQCVLVPNGHSLPLLEIEALK